MGKAGFVFASLMVVVSPSIFNVELRVSAFTTSTHGNVRIIKTLKGGELTNLRLSTIALNEVKTTTKSSSDELTVASAKSATKKSLKSKKSQKVQKKGNKNSKRSSKKASKGRQSKQKVQFKALKDLKLGSTVSGKVIETCEFGAFVDIGYNTQGSRYGSALLHISQIQDERVQNITDILNKGDTVEGARVIKIDYVKGEVGISLRKSRSKRKDISEFKVRDKLVGRVATVLNYGAFIDVGANVNPLLHISRVTGSAIENIRHFLNEGDTVPVHVIDIDVEKKTMAVSMLDKKADQYLDRRLSQKKRKFFGTAKETVQMNVDDESELDYFDQAIHELEAALKGR